MLKAIATAALVFVSILLVPSAYGDYRKGLALYRTEQDFAGAVREFREAAENRRFEGYEYVIREMAALKTVYYGVPREINAEMLRAIGVAAETGPPDIQWLMSRLWVTWAGESSGRDGEPVRWLIGAARGGHAEAAWVLWQDGTGGFDNQDRIGWLRRAAELGQIEAQREMVLLRAPIELSERVRWARALAERGDPLGYAYVGANYARGALPERDYPEAARWLRKAWDAGHRHHPVPQALLELYEGKHIPPASEQEVRSWREAARPRPPIID